MARRQTTLRTDHDVAFTPLGFAVNEITITNHAGEEVDIQNLVTTIEFTESLYAMPIKCVISVKDVLNILQDFKFVGQEHVKVHIGRQAFEKGESEEFELNFIVTSYPVYGRGSQPYAQAYDIEAVTPFAWIGQTINVARAINTPTVNEITKIIGELDGDQEVNVVGQCLSRINSILPNQSAAKTIKMLRDLSFDANNTPYHCYMTIDGVFNIVPYSYMNDSEQNAVMKQLYKDSLWLEDVFSKDAYDEKAQRIFSIASNLKIGKLDQAIGGAFMSHQNSFDLSTKHITSKAYKYDGTLIDTSWDDGRGQPIVSDDTNAIKYTTVWHSMNQSGTKDDNYLKAFVDTRQRRIAEQELFDSYEHELEVAGDFNLNPGKRIELFIPKAADLSTRDDSDEVYDPILSGEYIIVASIHKFGEEYKTTIQVKRNFSTVEL